MMRFLRTALLIVLLFASSNRDSFAQFSFGSGPIPMGATTCFTANVTGVGILEPPGWGIGWYLNYVTLNIVTNHPQTLVITITNPVGTILLLSAYNGAGGVNYTGCTFINAPATNIDGQPAPFTGSWRPEGGPLSVFDWQLGNGIWTICITDTASPGSGPGGGWGPGIFGNGASTAGAAIGFGNGSTLPVELVSFTGKSGEFYNELNWTTLSEINNDHFELERSTNGHEFVHINSVKGNGTTNSPSHYDYKDFEIDQQDYYYRLKQVDYDGESEYSQMILVKREKADNGKISSVFPNPFVDEMIITFSSSVDEMIQVELYNITGKQILSKSIVSRGMHCPIDFSEMTNVSGPYLLKLTTENEVKTFKVFRQ